MRVLVLHSDISPEAPPDEQDTLLQAAAIESALRSLGHDVSRVAFVPDLAVLRDRLSKHRPDVVFNLVEAIWGRSVHMPLVPAMLADLGIAHTGAGSGAIAVTNDKILAKRFLRAADLPTMDWAEAPDWRGLADGERWIVKSVDEHASIGIDDGAVVTCRAGALARAETCARRHGGRWFAERYIEGREFNAGIVERGGVPVLLPMGEMMFKNWDPGRPRILGYESKWHADAPDYINTPRAFGWNDEEPVLRDKLAALTRQCWHLFGLSGYARVDFRVDEKGQPFILEINANPCLEPSAGFAAAAAWAGTAYPTLIADIVHAARV